MVIDPLYILAKQSSSLVTVYINLASPEVGESQARPRSVHFQSREILWLRCLEHITMFSQIVFTMIEARKERKKSKEYVLPHRSDASL